MSNESASLNAPVNDAPLFVPARPSATGSTYPFRNPRPLAIAVTVFAGLKVLATVLQAVGLVLRLDFLTRFQAGQFPTQEAIAGAARFSDTLVQGASIGLLAALVIGYIVGGRWIYVAACNIRALGARGMDISPGWAVGWYAIPLLNWIRPYSAMSEIDRASHNPDGWRSRGDALILRYWWAGWIISNLSDAAVNIMSRGSPGAEGLTNLTWMMLVNDALHVGAVALFLTVVWRIVRAQMASRHQVNQVADAFS